MSNRSIIGRITGIKRYEIHDGDGLRTTVFLKGCPLRCEWCHNPETQSYEKELAIYEGKCMHESCIVKKCSFAINPVADEQIFEDKKKRALSEDYVDVCPTQALTMFGRDINVKELSDILFEDKIFYDATSGGVTLSGGEPLFQADFCAAVLKALKEREINTAVDTCLYSTKMTLNKIIPYTDTFLVDLKAMDDTIHKRYTGVGNKRIFNNIAYLDSLNKRMEIRIPYIPEINDDEIEKSAKFLKQFRNIVAVKVLPYHNLSDAKYDALNMPYKLKHIRIPDKDEIEGANRILEKYELKPIRDE